MTITWNTDVNAPGCPGEILSDNGESLLIQLDWDYPGTAQTFGWSLGSIQKPVDEYCPQCGQDFETDDPQNCTECDWERPGDCEHDGTDGTVDCKHCGVTAGEFIAAACDWLENNDGATAEDPGYFDGQ